ncbi:lipoprotein [Caballeronia arationis]|uniref:DUF799 domain-containing protein n=1 Tax=Caballeronia arationis TaxID=1777142 RepID=UPI00074CA618|nr:GNA1162 family protein [Caballeronia arationis]SAK89720.1 lipoprotein [Caballeronia arationis]
MSTMARLMKLAFAAASVTGIVACAPVPVHADYSAFRHSDPHSILVVPVVNRSVDVDAPDYFLSTISKPLAERGYYVFPVNLTKRVMEDDGLGDADLVHANDPTVLGKMFGADSIMYITINRWDAQYAVLATSVTVDLSYALKSGTTGETLWTHKQTMVYSPQASTAGNPLAALIAAAITAAIAKAKPNYVPLAQQANAISVYKAGQGLPAGPYDGQYKSDGATF